MNKLTLIIIILFTVTIGWFLGAFTMYNINNTDVDFAKKWLPKKPCPEPIESKPKEPVSVNCKDYIDLIGAMNLQIFDLKNQDVVIYEPKIYQKCIKIKCPICNYSIWEGRVNTLNIQLKEALLQYKMNCR